ncbi:MAG: hypothetical protein K9J80_16805, partial [Sulfuritalea sp.]|nr:hypothetical protein [Sulfuritalea sp.]
MRDIGVISKLEKIFAVVAHLGNGFVDVGQCLMLVVFFDAVRLFLLSAFGKSLDGAHGEIAIMEIALQLRHPA